MKSKFLVLFFLIVGLSTFSCSVDDDIQITEQGTGGIEDTVQPDEED